MCQPVMFLNLKLWYLFENSSGCLYIIIDSSNGQHLEDYLRHFDLFLTEVFVECFNQMVIAYS